MNAAIALWVTAVALTQPVDTTSPSEDAPTDDTATDDTAADDTAAGETATEDVPEDSPEPPPAQPDDPAATPGETTDEAFEPDPDRPWAPEPEELAEEEPPPPPSEAAARRQGPSYLEDDAADGKSKKSKRKKRVKRDPYESPQRFAVEVKVGPYLPDVDRSYTGPRQFGPYAKIFGSTDTYGITTEAPGKAVMGAVAFEWQFLNPGQIGPLALGFQFSVFTDSAKALFAEYIDVDDPSQLPEDVDSIRSEADSVRFTAFPLALQLVYRLEYFADRFRVPLVPYAKGGVGYAFWYSTGGDGSISVNSAGQKARGGVWGYQINAGGMLRLDFLERGTARTLDRATGINHTYIFGEYQFSQLDNFGRASSISLGDSTFFIGLAMEF